MNYKSIFTSITLITLCVISLVATYVLWPRPTGFDNTGKIDRQRFPEGEELRQRWKLPPGAFVRVSHIAGNVTIETHDSDLAEVYVERAARQRSVLSQMKLAVTYNPTENFPNCEDFPECGLRVTNPAWQAQKEGPPRPLRRLGFGQTPDFRERVILKLPRQVQLSISSIKGDLSIGEVDGDVWVVDVAGGVSIAQATTVRRLMNIKGSVQASLVRLSSGINVDSVGGPVKLHFLEPPDTRIRGDMVLGPIITQLPGFTLTQKSFFRFRGQTGQGEKLILLNHILGSVTLDFVSEPQLAKTPLSR